MTFFFFEFFQVGYTLQQYNAKKKTVIHETSNIQKAKTSIKLDTCTIRTISIAEYRNPKQADGEVPEKMDSYSIMAT